MDSVLLVDWMFFLFPKIVQIRIQNILKEPNMRHTFFSTFLDTVSDCHHFEQ